MNRGPNQIALGLLILASLLFFFGCKHHPEQPIVEQKNLRELTWTTDTIAFPGSFQTDMYNIWASSPDNVYIVGHNDQNDGFMFHYNGNEWSNVPMTTLHGGFINGRVDLTSIIGFDSANIWAVGEQLFNNPDPNGPFLDSALIVMYNGYSWSRQEVAGARGLVNVWGTSPTDVWACGYNTILHYDGQKWSKDSVYLPGSFIQFNGISGTSPSNVLIIADRVDQVNGANVNNYLLYHYDGTSWSLIDSTKTGSETFGEHMCVIGGSMYSVGYGLWKYTGSSWLQIIPSQLLWVGIAGTDQKNLLVCGMLGQVQHFNGSDWYQYAQLESFEYAYSGIWTDGTSVFVVGYNGYKTIVSRGK